VGLAPVELEDPLGDVVQEVAVVGDRQDRARVALEVPLQPLDRLGVEVVGRLVEQQERRLLEQQLAQRHPAALTTGEGVDDRVGRRAAQRVHRLVQPAVEVPHVRRVELALQGAGLVVELVEVGVRVTHRHVEVVEPLHLRLELADGLLDVLEDGPALGQRRLLLEHPDRGVGVDDGVAVVRVLEPRHDLQERRLARAVGPDDADLGAVQERQGDIVENDLVAMGLAHVAQREHVLSHGRRA
jgi:hypothetical protein